MYAAHMLVLEPLLESVAARLAAAGDERQEDKNIHLSDSAVVQTALEPRDGAELTNACRVQQEGQPEGSRQPV